MGRLIVIVLIAAGIWMGYWAFGSTALERSLSAWIDDRRAAGWVADVGDLDVAGFPNRFDTTLTDVQFADPSTGVAWSAPFLQLLALSYRPNQVIAVLPPEHRLSTPVQTIDITSDSTQGSIYLGAATNLPLDRSTIISDNLRLTSSLDWEVSLDQARFATEPIPVRENAHRIGAELKAVDLPRALDRALNPTGVLPETVETLRLDTEIGFTAPWDRFAIEHARPQITDIDIGDLSLNWGDVIFQAAGELTVDSEGRAEGQIDIRAVEWRRLLDMAISTGVLDRSLRNTVENGLNLLAGLSGNPDTIDAPLTFRGDVITIGPIPIGPAPRFVIR